MTKIVTLKDTVTQESIYPMTSVAGVVDENGQKIDEIFKEISEKNQNTVTNTEISVKDHVAVFVDETGKVIRDSGFTIETSVPADAKFTDTTYTLSSFGITSSASELNHCKGVTSSIQTQINNKAATDQNMFIGTTQVAINRQSAALTLNDVNISGNAGSATYVTRDRGSNTVTTLASLPISKSLVIANLSKSTTLSVASGMNVGDSITVICNPTAKFTQPIPTTGAYKSMDGDSLNVISGKPFEINIVCYAASKYSISCKVAK